jgi:hypothetical protein
MDNIENQIKKEPIDKKTYMREYKRKQFRENGDAIKEKNKAYYYKYKFNISTEDLKKYDIHLPIVARIRKELEELKNKNPDIIKEILEPYFL